MPRGPEIVDFAGKLRLAMARANLSRAQLAQAAGVDKSVVARWLNGALAPSDHSLTMLTAALARTIEGFGRADWDLPSDALTRRLGLEVASPAGTPAAATPVAGVFPRTHEATVRGLAHAEAVYAGVWAVIFPTPTANGRIYPFALRIRRRPGATALEIEYLNRIVIELRGPAFVVDDVLFGVMEKHRHVGLALMMLQGSHTERTLVLDGVLSTQGVSGRLFGVRVLAFRLAVATDDPVLEATVARVMELSGQDFETLLPPAMLAAFRRPPADATGPQWMVLDPAASWALGATRLRDPACRDAAEALAAVRAMFADVVAMDRPG